MADRNEFNQQVIEEFRANGGKVTGQFANRPIILVTHRGAKSGRSYTTPLVYSRDGERIVIVASKGGAPRNPDWYYNLVANPTVTVEIGTARFQARVHVASDEERERLFGAHAKQMPVFEEYKKKTARQIPVFVLERVA